MSGNHDDELNFLNSVLSDLEEAQVIIEEYRSGDLGRRHTITGIEKLLEVTTKALRMRIKQLKED